MLELHRAGLLLDLHKQPLALVAGEPTGSRGRTPVLPIGSGAHSIARNPPGKSDHEVERISRWFTQTQSGAEAAEANQLSLCVSCELL